MIFPLMSLFLRGMQGFHLLIFIYLVFSHWILCSKVFKLLLPKKKGEYPRPTFFFLFHVHMPCSGGVLISHVDSSSSPSASARGSKLKPWKIKSMRPSLCWESVCLRGDQGTLFALFLTGREIVHRQEIYSEISLSIETSIFGYLSLYPQVS